jgi:hypothetical protein
MLVDMKFRFDAEKNNELNWIERKAYREWSLEMNPFECKLVKLPNRKMKSIVVEENGEYKDWGLV